MDAVSPYPTELIGSGSVGAWVEQVVLIDESMNAIGNPQFAHLIAADLDLGDFLCAAEAVVGETWESQEG